MYDDLIYEIGQVIDLLGSNYLKLSAVSLLRHRNSLYLAHETDVMQLIVFADTTRKKNVCLCLQMTEALKDSRVLYGYAFLSYIDSVVVAIIARIFILLS